MNTPETTYRRLREISQRRRYPQADELISDLEKVLDTLNNEPESLRPRDSGGKTGGLLYLNKDIPTVIVPDLHARAGYLMDLAYWEPPGLNETIIQALHNERVQVVCVGDGFHSERREKKRWQEGWKEYLDGFKRHSSMDKEMTESLAVMQIIMEWKILFPEHFHFLKGNHENIANENKEGNRSFRKFAYEGEMVSGWFKMFLGQECFDKYYIFEKNLPIFAVGNGFCITHAEPRIYYPPQRIINYRGDDEVIFDHTWTDNDAAEQDSVETILKNYFPDRPDSLMFGGHRIIDDRYKLRAGGKYIQIHHPDRNIAAFITKPEDFNLDNNIIILPSE